MRYYFFFPLLLLLLGGCGVRYKTVPYYTDLPNEAFIEEQIQNQTVLTIQKNDVLAITVSSLNPEASAIFNLGNTSSAQNSTAISDPSMTANGFMVDTNGDIQLPVVGSIHVEGLTTAEARARIQTKLNDFLKEPVVNLRLANFRISVLGDVSKPGVYPVNNERINLSEALSMAGDLNITAVRNNVLLVREKDGKRQYIRINMNNKELFNSPYYYLQNNDVLYIQPGNAKYASVDTSYRNVGILITALSFLALLISRF